MPRRQEERIAKTQKTLLNQKGATLEVGINGDAA